MMKIGVISDTHLRESNLVLEEVVEKYFSDVDLILHAGDLVSMDVLHAFKGKEVIAVTGNSDSPEVRRRFRVSEVIPANQFKIGLVHGWGLPFGLEKRVASAFEDIQCLVFGHSHRALVHRRNGILYFNPGSYSKGMPSLWHRTIGRLTIGEDIQAKIIRL